MAALVTLGSAACHKAGPKGAYAVRDSSGVQIVSNPSAVEGDSGCPQVGSAPAFSIGGANAEGPYDIARVTGAQRLADGSIVLLNGATSELRYFDGAGRYVRSVGRKGSGPGEFESPYQLLRYGPDTLMVQDFSTARITLLGTDGTFYGDVSLRGFFGGSLVGRLPDGSLVLSALQPVRPGQGTSGRSREPAPLVRVSREGVVLDTLGEYPGSENVREISEHSASVGQATFGRSTVFTVADSLLYVGDNAVYRVRVLAGGRRLIRIIEKAQPPAPVTAAMVDSEKARRSRRGTDPRWREVENRMWALDRLPETLPAFRNIAVDADGWLWVRPYSLAHDGGISWDVFDPAGRLRCAVRLPATLAAREVGHDHFLGVVTDDDGVEQLQFYQLRRGARSPI
jgi:hypothetical protein